MEDVNVLFCELFVIEELSGKINYDYVRAFQKKVIFTRPSTSRGTEFNILFMTQHYNKRQNN